MKNKKKVWIKVMARNNFRFFFCEKANLTPSIIGLFFYLSSTKHIFMQKIGDVFKFTLVNWTKATLYIKRDIDTKSVTILYKLILGKS